VTGIALASYLATGALAGILAGLLGIGGGILIVPVLIFAFSAQGLTAEWVPHLAIGTSLATIIGTGATAVYSHHRRGAVRWDLVARLGPGMVLGAWLGAAVAGLLPEAWLTRVFALFLLVVAARMLGGQAAQASSKLPGTTGLLAAGTGIGALSALVGIGGGSLTVPLLVRGGIDMRGAVATSSGCGLPIALAGAAGFLVAGWGREGLPAAATGFIYWPAVPMVLLTSIPAAPLGAHLAHRLPVALLRRVFGVLLLLVGLRLLMA